MFKLKGYTSRLTCKQIGGTNTYGRLLRWGQGKTYFPGNSPAVLSTLRKGVHINLQTILSPYTP